jgi:hypothetical protein
LGNSFIAHPRNQLCLVEADAHQLPLDQIFNRQRNGFPLNIVQGGCAPIRSN